MSQLTGLRRWVLLLTILGLAPLSSCTSPNESTSLITWVTVEERAVLEQLRLSGRLTLVEVGKVFALDSGRITQPFATAELVHGSVLTALNDRAVVVANMTRPLHRKLSAGDAGLDVAEVRDVLTSLGYPSQSLQGIDHFDEHLEAAVRQWQSANGSVVDGKIEPTDLASAPFPSQARTELQLGDLVLIGDLIASLVQTTPTIEIDVAANQRSSLSIGQDAIVAGATSSWTATIQLVAEDPFTLDDGSRRYRANLLLLGDTGDFDEPEGSILNVILTVADHGTGLAVPAGSITELKQGEFAVQVRTAGTETDETKMVPVVVLGSDGNWTLVTGDLEAGQMVRLPGAP